METSALSQAWEAGTCAILALLGRQRSREGRGGGSTPGLSSAQQVSLSLASRIHQKGPFRNSPRTGEMGTQATPHGPGGAIHAGASPAPPARTLHPVTEHQVLSLRWEGGAWKTAHSQIFLFGARTYSMGFFKCPVFKGHWFT